MSFLHPDHVDDIYYRARYPYRVKVDWLTPQQEMREPRINWCVMNLDRTQWKVSNPGGCRPMTFLFRQSKDATIFSLKWS